MQQLQAIVHGKVQGVFFRAWTRDVAMALGLSGWVRNLPDGSVETLAQGEPEALSRFEEQLNQGPPLSRVTKVDSHTEAVDAPLTGFEIRR